MVTNVYFNNFENFGEQNLIEDLIIESIKQYGHDIYYCPRTLVAKDDIYGEDTVSEYNSSYYIDMYIKSFDSYEGDGTFLSKFNLEIRDQMRFVVAMRTFNDEVGSYEMIDRPQEGDLIYSPMMKRIFVIMYVNNKSTFYQLGSLQSYELVCEVFEYSNERFNTGIEEIDNIETTYSFALDSFELLSSDGSILITNDNNIIALGDFDFDTQLSDMFADNNEFEKENTDNEIIDWSARDPFSEAIE